MLHMIISISCLFIRVLVVVNGFIVSCRFSHCCLSESKKSRVGKCAFVIPEIADSRVLPVSHWLSGQRIPVPFHCQPGCDFEPSSTGLHRVRGGAPVEKLRWKTGTGALHCRPLRLRSDSEGESI
ncbi:hypothetical protein EDD17DRAFT_1651882 [Pisolithus thermaeus]|nr:hypothetical protein EDD17DRAFT_1651882 [Pisolithus thermaeus]